MVDIGDIPDFPDSPGQRPTPGAPSDVTPLAVVLVTAALDREYLNMALNAAAVDAFIAAQVAADLAYSTTVERWSPWSPLQLEIPLAVAARYNYARFSVGGRSWYGFLDADYLNLTTTVYTVTPDAWTTYGPTIGYSTVLRAHVAVAASAAGDIGFCLEPEDFSPGALVGYSEYQADPLGTAKVLVISTTDLRADPFVAVDADRADTAADFIPSAETDGDIVAPITIGTDASFHYQVGNTGDGYDDPFFYPYADSAGLSSGNTMYRPIAVGATPSTVDGIPAEGGAFLYASIGAAVTHLSKLAHAPWIADGIQRAMLVPGGSAGGLAPVDLSPRDAVPDTSGAPTYEATFSTSLSSTTVLTGDWTAGLPADYGVWTKLRTAPFSNIQLGDRAGSTDDHDPQAIVGLGALQLHFEGVFFPNLDVVSWLVGAEGVSDANTPMGVPIRADLPAFAVGRDSVLAGQAAGLSAERSQSIIDLLTAVQRAGADRSFTLASSYLATTYAVAESA
jgi:hypothetical protein